MNLGVEDQVFFCAEMDHKVLSLRLFKLSEASGLISDGARRSRAALNQKCIGTGQGESEPHRIKSGRGEAEAELYQIKSIGTGRGEVEAELYQIKKYG